MFKMSDNAKEKDYQRLVEQETLIFEATELLSELIEDSGVTRKELADKLGRSKGFVTQVLAGTRNMTLRTFSDFAFALEHRVEVGAVPLALAEDGGEPDSGQARVEARVYAGIGAFNPASCEVGLDPRRQEAAEGALHANWIYLHATQTGSFPSSVKTDRTLAELSVGAEEPAELEAVAG